MGNLSDEQLAKIAKANAPKKLGAIKPSGGKKPIDSKFKSAWDIKQSQAIPEHIESTATILGLQSVKTNDNTLDVVNPPSMAKLQPEIDEESILRDVIQSEYKN